MRLPERRASTIGNGRERNTMNRTKDRLNLSARRALVALALGSGSWLALHGLAQAADTSTPIYAPIGASRPRGAASSVAAIDERELSANIGALAANPTRIALSRLDGKLFHADRTGFEQRAPDDFTWRGRVAPGGDASEGDVTLTVKHGVLAGLITLRDEVYEIQAHGTRPRLLKLDQSRFPPCGNDDSEAAPMPANGARTDVVAPQPSGVARAGVSAVAEIDVLALYTPQARTGAGGQANIEATLQAAVDAANTAFAASGLDAHFNLVHTALANHNDAGNTATDLAWVTSDATVRTLRNQHYADLVALVTENGGSACGQANVQRAISPDFSESAFQVTARGCAVGNLSYAHEHGHNLGFEHNPENAIQPASNASLPWSFGYYVNGVFSTVMSYTNPCTSGCTRVQRFSNPNVTLSGYPTGIADQRDNVRTGNISAPVVAGFRQAGLDTDGDGIEDVADDCPVVADPSQIDSDGDAIGDACELALQAKLSPPGDLQNVAYQFGASVAISGDTLVVGADSGYESGTATRPGSVFVYQRTGSTWSLSARIDGEHAGDQFGSAVALDGDTLVVFAWIGDAVYIYRRSGGTWGLEKKLANTGFIGKRSIALEGDTLAVGTVSGARSVVQVYTRSGTTWTQGPTLLSSDGVSNDYFGQAVALQGDRLAVGAFSHDAAGVHWAGTAYVFDRGPSGWTQSAELMAADPQVQGAFGEGVVLDGDMLLVGAPSADDDLGAIYRFDRTGGVWNQTTKIRTQDAKYPDGLGYVLALQGHTLLAGEQASKPIGPYSGKAFVYDRVGDVWRVSAKIVPADGVSYAYFGSAAAIDHDTFVIGAYHDPAPGNDKGSVYVYTRVPDQPDHDSDGVPDATDNCPDLSNPGQEDSNGNGIGDACEVFADDFEDGNLTKWSASSP